MSEMPKQDMPPKGGFPKIRWARNIPKSRITSGILIAGYLALTLRGADYWISWMNKSPYEKYPLMEKHRAIAFNSYRKKSLEFGKKTEAQLEQGKIQLFDPKNRIAPGPRDISFVLPFSNLFREDPNVVIEKKED